MSQQLKKTNELRCLLAHPRANRKICSNLKHFPFLMRWQHTAFLLLLNRTEMFVVPLNLHKLIPADRNFFLSLACEEYEDLVNCWSRKQLQI